MPQSSSMTKATPALASCDMLSRIDTPVIATTWRTPGVALAMRATSASAAPVRPSEAPSGICTPIIR